MRRLTNHFRPHIQESTTDAIGLVTACQIISKGKIIGIALDPNTGETHGYLATPIRGTQAASANVRKPPVLQDWGRSRVRGGYSVKLLTRRPRFCRPAISLAGAV